jgi:transcription elongation factor Elf1
MTSEKELKISYDELTRVIWNCSKCGAEQVLDIFNDEQTKRLYPPNKIFKCGICGSVCDSSLFEALKLLVEFYDELKKSPTKIFFRISTKDEKEEAKI